MIGWRADLPAALVLATLGVLLAAEDAANHRLPNALLAPGALATLLLLLLAAGIDDAWPALGRGLLAALVAGTAFFIMALARPSGLGMGDVKLAALLGLWLGWLSWQAVLLGVLLAFLAGGLLALALLVAGRAQANTPIAFGPWLLLGAVLATALTRTLA